MNEPILDMANGGRVTYRMPTWVGVVGGVVLILGLFVDVAPRGNQLGLAKFKTAQLDEDALLNGVDRFLLETGGMPASLNELVPRFVKAVHQDPWGGTYQLQIRGDQYAIVSLGPSQQAGATEIVASRSLPQPKSQHQKPERHSP